MRPAAPPVLKSRSSLVNSFVKLLIEDMAGAMELLGALKDQSQDINHQLSSQSCLKVNQPGQTVLEELGGVLFQVFLKYSR